MAATVLLSTLLRALLDRAPLGHRASPALCHVVATGLCGADSAGFESADALADALQPFEGPDPNADLRALFARWRAVCDLANDLPEAAQTVRLVLLDATNGVARSAIIRKPDRRRYERVAFDAVLRAAARVPTTSESADDNRDTTADADETYRIRELALASALLLIMVPAGLWFGDSLEPFVRHAVTAARPIAVSGGTVTTGGPDEAVPGPDEIAARPSFARATTISAPMSNLASMAMDPSTPLTDEWLTARVERVALRDTGIGDSPLKRRMKARTRAKTYYLQPSPDGKRVAFDSERGGIRAIYVADRDGKNVRRVSGIGLARRPVWSPDGRRLAFERAERGGRWNLWTVEVGSGELRQVSFDRTGRPRGVSWFPKSRAIGYSFGSELRIVDLKSGETRRFRAPRRSRIGTPTVSPDGRRIVFTAGTEGTWLLDLSTNGREQMRRILTDPSARAFSWAPDGKRLAYFSPRQGNWIVIPQ